MADECTDVSNKEQLAICIRWVDSRTLEPNEDMIGLYKIDDIKASTIVHVIKDALTRMQLSLKNCRGQCYDGASNMTGRRSGVAKQLEELEPQALFLHCHGHALNLAAGNAIKKCKLMRDALDTTFEVSKLVKFSPKRDSLFDKLKADLAPRSPGFRVLCPTRWTVRADSLKSVLLNYGVLQELWACAKEDTSDPTIKARIIGVETQFRSFNYLFGVHLGELILRHTDNLSKVLQSTTISASDGNQAAMMTLSTMYSLRNEHAFETFWAKVLRQQGESDVTPPQLPRKRKVPSPFESGRAEAEFHSDCKALHRQQYYEALDLVTTSIKERFHQKGFQVYRNLEDLLLLCVRGQDLEEALTQVTDFYREDLDADQLKAHLIVFSATYSGGTECIGDIRTYLKGLSRGQRLLISEVVKVMNLILVMPSTNAVSERSFSALRRLKTYLRSTMNQSRLNHLLILNVHKELTDNLCLTAVAQNL